MPQAQSVTVQDRRCFFPSSDPWWNGWALPYTPSDDDRSLRLTDSIKREEGNEHSSNEDSSRIILPDKVYRFPEIVRILRHEEAYFAVASFEGSARELINRIQASCAGLRRTGSDFNGTPEYLVVVNEDGLAALEQRAIEKVEKATDPSMWWHCQNSQWFTYQLDRIHDAFRAFGLALSWANEKGYILGVGLAMAKKDQRELYLTQPSDQDHAAHEQALPFGGTKLKATLAHEAHDQLAKSTDMHDDGASQQNSNGQDSTPSSVEAPSGGISTNDFTGKHVPSEESSNEDVHIEDIHNGTIDRDDIPSGCDMSNGDIAGGEAGNVLVANPNPYTIPETPPRSRQLLPARSLLQDLVHMPENTYYCPELTIVLEPNQLSTAKRDVALAVARSLPRVVPRTSMVNEYLTRAWHAADAIEQSRNAVSGATNAMHRLIHICDVLRDIGTKYGGTADRCVLLDQDALKSYQKTIEQKLDEVRRLDCKRDTLQARIGAYWKAMDEQCYDPELSAENLRACSEAEDSLQMTRDDLTAAIG